MTFFQGLIDPEILEDHACFEALSLATYLYIERVRIAKDCITKVCPIESISNSWSKRRKWDRISREKVNFCSYVHTLGRTWRRRGHTLPGESRSSPPCSGKPTICTHTFSDRYGSRAFGVDYDEINVTNHNNTLRKASLRSSVQSPSALMWTLTQSSSGADVMENGCLNAHLVHPLDKSLFHWGVILFENKIVTHEI